MRCVGLRSLAVGSLLFGALSACRHYDYEGRTAHEKGLIPATQFARYGREQAQVVAAGRELAHADSTAAAVAYASSLPDVVGVTADSGHTWLTLHFKSGWRIAAVPVTDGKRGAETAGLPSAQ